jgi:hypothetical protein
LAKKRFLESGAGDKAYVDAFSPGKLAAGSFASMAGVGAAGAMLAGGAGLAGLGAGLSALAAAGVVGGLLGGFGGALIGKELASELKKNSDEVVANQRTRNADGRFRAKSGNTQVETLRETYGPNFAAGLPGNMPLQVLRSSTGMSLTQLVKNPDKINEKKEELSAWEPPKPAPGGRARNADGTIRQKRSDTRIDTLRKTYGMDFAAQLPGNWPLGVLRESTGMSLTELVNTPDAVRDALPDITAAAGNFKAEDKTA